MLQSFMSKFFKIDKDILKDEFIAKEINGLAKSKQKNLCFRVDSDKREGVVGICYNDKGKDICCENRFNAKDEKYKLNSFKKFELRSVKSWVCYKLYKENTDTINAIVSFEINREINAAGINTEFIEQIFENFIDELIEHIPYLID